MNKDQERRLFDRVFPADTFPRVQDSECPDFICFRGGRPVLGVEVTELFLHEGSARLEKIPGYTRNLLNGGDYRHKKDVEFLPIKTVVFHPNDANRQEVQGIVTELPPMEQRVALLRATIEKKTARMAEYTRKAPLVDLIIDDRDRMFRITDRSKAAKLFLSQHLLGSVAASGFREIHFLTECTDGTTIIVPARLNILVEEVLRCEYAIHALCREQQRRLSVGNFGASMGAYLAAHGFPEVRLFLLDGEIIIVTSVGRFILGKERRELKDSIGVEELGSEMAFPAPATTVSAGEESFQMALAELAHKWTFNISFTKEAGNHTLPNKASDATSEPAPGAASSSHQG